MKLRSFLAFVYFVINGVSFRVRKEHITRMFLPEKNLDGLPSLLERVPREAGGCVLVMCSNRRVRYTSQCFCVIDQYYANNSGGSQNIEI